MSYKHDFKVQLTEHDEQSTSGRLFCSKCHRRTRPIYRKDEMQEAMEEKSCPIPDTLEELVEEVTKEPCIDDVPISNM